MQSGLARTSSRGHDSGSSVGPTMSVKYQPCAENEETEVELVGQLERRASIPAADEEVDPLTAGGHPTTPGAANGPRQAVRRRTSGGGHPVVVTTHPLRADDEVVVAHGPPSPLAFPSPDDRTRLIGERLSSVSSQQMMNPGVSPVTSPITSASRGSGGVGPSDCSPYQLTLQRTDERVASRLSLMDSTLTYGEAGGRSEEMAVPRPQLPRLSKEEAVAATMALHKAPHSIGNRSVGSSRQASVSELARHSTTVISSRKLKLERRRDIKRLTEKWETSTASSEKSSCKFTFAFDPSGRLSYYWSAIVSFAFLYNFWVIIYRFAFEEISPKNIAVWFPLDYLMDLIYALDIAYGFRCGFLDEGVLQTSAVRMRMHYMNSTKFYVDCLSLLPLEFLYLSFGFNSMLRCFRLVKIYRFWIFLDRTERHTNYPNVFRSIVLTHYLLVIFHWNACFYYLISRTLGFGSNEWIYVDEDAMDQEDKIRAYLNSFYWSTLTLTAIGDLPRPRSNAEYLFVIIELIFGLFMFATVLGHVANIVTAVSAARKEFQSK